METSYLKSYRWSGVLQDYGGEEQRAGLGAWLQGGEGGVRKKHKRQIQDKTQMTNEHNSQKDKQNYSLSLNSGVFSCVQQRPRRLHSS